MGGVPWEAKSLTECPPPRRSPPAVTCVPGGGSSLSRENPRPTGLLAAVASDFFSDQVRVLLSKPHPAFTDGLMSDSRSQPAQVGGTVLGQGQLGGGTPRSSPVVVRAPRGLGSCWSCQCRPLPTPECPLGPRPSPSVPTRPGPSRPGTAAGPDTAPRQPGPPRSERGGCAAPAGQIAILGPAADRRLGKAASWPRRLLCRAGGGRAASAISQQSGQASAQAVCPWLRRWLPVAGASPSTPSR